MAGTVDSIAHNIQLALGRLAKVRTDIGRVWTYVRDRPFGGPAPPAAVFHYLRDRRGEHPCDHLARYMTLESVSQMSEDPLVKLPAMAA